MPMPRLSLRTGIAWTAATLWLAAAALAPAQPVKRDHVEVELVAERAAIEPGKPFYAGLRLKHEDHWHTYWRNPGDSGLPTKLAWTLPPGFAAGEIEWPAPKRLPLGPLANFGYEGETLLPVRIMPPDTFLAQEATLKVKADWLICKDVCIPGNADLTLTLPVVKNASVAESPHAALFRAAREATPRASADLKASAHVQGNTLMLALTSTAANAQLADVAFFPYAESFIANAGEQKLSRTQNGWRLDVPLDAGAKQPASLEGVITAKGMPPIAITAAFSAEAPPAATGSAPSSVSSGAPSNTPSSLALALAFALIGGAILNLMPCVFPVLGLKILGFAGQSGQVTIRLHGLVFAAGVIVSFWLLAGVLFALRAAGEAVGWGFQLQSPAFITVLAILFMLIALNLSGVFEVGVSMTRLGNKDHSSTLAGSFFSGVLAVAVATPCTAPFMGSALGYTLSQSMLVGFAVFTALGVGMALPYLLLSYFPAWIHKLPRPGPWMETFKQFLAFPMYATVAWLVWVLAQQVGIDAVLALGLGLTFVALAAWLYGRFVQRQGRFAVPGIAAVAALVAGLAIAWPAGKGDAQAANAKSANGAYAWQPYSRAKVDALVREGKPVFVDFTAAWCVTCQANKRLVLEREKVASRFKALGVVMLKADWTNQDPEITAALAQFGRNGVPLYLLYVPGDKDSPRVLPELLTSDIVLTELDRIDAARRTAGETRVAAPRS